MGRRVELSQEQIDTIIYNYVILKKGLIPTGKIAGVSQKVVERVLENTSSLVVTKNLLQKKKVLMISQTSQRPFRKDNQE